MTGNEYQKLAARTISSHVRVAQLSHALFGLMSEVGELSGLYQKEFQGHSFDPEHAKKEVGDILWMIAEYCTGMGWDLEDIMQLNIDKLKARYPNGFDPQRSIHRADGDI